MLENLFNLETEQAIISSILNQNKALDRITCGLKGEHFSNSLLGDVFDYCVSLWDVGQRFELPRVAGKFPDLKNDLQVLQNASVTSVNIDDYAHVVLDYFKKRMLLLSVEDAKEQLKQDHTFDLVGSVDECISELNKTNTVGFESDLSEVSNDILVSLEHRMKNKKIVDVVSGIEPLDEATGGFRKGNLYILAGRPGMGKSAFVSTVINNSILKGFTSGLVSLEMTSNQFLTRVACLRSGIAYWKIDKGSTLPDEYTLFAAALSEIEGLKMTDVSGLNFSKIRSLARKWVKRDKIKILFVDHIGLADLGDMKNKRSDQAIGDFTKALKIMAKDLDIPIVAVCQLSRNVERRENKRPMLSDLRDSGRIEEDADVILFLYRAEYYLKDMKPAEGAYDYKQNYDVWVNSTVSAKGKAELIIAKNRHGEIKTIPCQFDAELMEFRG